MINSASPRPPHGSADSAASASTNSLPTRPATGRRAHSDLGPRLREQGDTGHSLAPRHRLGPSQQTPQQGPLSWLNSRLLQPTQDALAALERYGEALIRPYMTTPPLQAFLPPPVATWAYQAPSDAGLQSVSFTPQMTPEDARAALLAMDISPQFLEAMKSDLNHCTNPYSAGWSADSPRQFVATYGQLVDMPNGLDYATVAALHRMLATPEPATPPAFTTPPGAQAAQPQQQILPVMEMTLADARAALRAMEVAPEMLARMTKDVLGCVETAGSQVGQERAQHFKSNYGHLLAMPPHLDAAALTTLVNLLMNLDQVEPQAEPHVAKQPDTPQPLVQRVPLHAMDPADALQALLAMDVPEQKLLTMAQDLDRIFDAWPVKGQEEDEGDRVDVGALAHKFAQDHGHLIDLPVPLDLNTVIALGQMLESYQRKVD
jgi:hypothetical protein